jgi:uncharacterized membrane protein YvlD (DUF360 family)
MIRFLVRTLGFLVSAAIGLLVADLVLPDFHVDARSFVIDVVIFTVLQSILSPLLIKIAAKNAPRAIGAVGLVSTFLALVITAWLSDGLQIDGTQTWLLATLIVWIVTLLAALFLPALFVRKLVEERRGRAADTGRSRT